MLHMGRDGSGDENLLQSFCAGGTPLDLGQKQGGGASTRWGSSNKSSSQVVSTGANIYIYISIYHM